MNIVNKILIISLVLLGILLLTGSANAATWTVDDSGGAHFTKIQDAVDAADIGDIIYVYNGTYHEHITITKSLILSGQSESNAIINGDGSGNVIHISNSDVTINKFTIKNAGVYGLYAINSNVNFDNITITGNGGNGIYVVHGKSLTIRNSTIEGNGGGIIYGGNRATGDAIIEDNTITNNIGSGVSLILVQGMSATIKNNEIDNNFGGSSDGIYCSIAGAGGVMTIENNPVTNSGRIGIYLVGTKTGSTIANFAVQDSGSNGIRADVSDLNFDNITITGNDGNGIYVVHGKSLTIRNSTIDGNGGGLIYGGNRATGDAIIEDNIITNNIGSGVSLILVEGMSATIKNNEIDNNAGASSNGMYVGIAGTGGIMNIQNNPVTNSGSHGIYLSGVKSGSTIKDFTVLNSGSDGLRADYSDLNLENVTTFNNGGYGIYFVHGKGFTIRNSKIDGNGGGIIYGGNRAISNAVVEDNIITNNVGSGLSVILTEGKSATIKNNEIDNNAGASSRGMYVGIAGTGGIMNIQNNPVTNSGSYGIYLSGVRFGSNIGNFTVQNSGSDGLRADYSDLNLENVTAINNGGYGIYFVHGKDFTIRNSKIDGNGGGIIYYDNAAGDAIVEDNIITNNVGTGIHIGLIEGKSATIRNNKIDNNAGASSRGMYVGIAGTGGIMNIQNNPVTNSGSHGIYLSGVKSGSTIKDFTVLNSGSDGLRADYSDLNLENVTTINNGGYGIYFVHGKGFTIQNSKIDGNGGGIIYGGNRAISDAVVEDNIITNNVGSGLSVILTEGKSATIKNNEIDNNFGGSSDGIFCSIAGAGGVMTIENNPVTNSGRIGIYLEGTKTGSTIANFTVQDSGSNGIRADVSDLNFDNITITGNGGNGIYVVSGKSFTIRNSTIDGNGGGIIYGGNRATGDAIIEDNTIANNIGSGISLILVEGMSATIKNNEIDNNFGGSSDGIFCSIAGAGGVMTIENNPVTNSGRHGIYLIGAKNSAIIDNNISTNIYGIRLDSSSNNLIYHNNFIANKNYNANDNGGSNTWDDGYPSGGNYWSDYTGNDNFKGPDQDQPGSDGIGDTPYDIAGSIGATDFYPFMEPLSGIDKEFDIQLSVGWNLIGYNSLYSQPIADALSSISGNYSIVWAYNASDTTDHWKKYDPGVPFGNDLINMEPGRGYWIMMTSEGILII